LRYVCISHLKLFFQVNGASAGECNLTRNRHRWTEIESNL